MAKLWAYCRVSTKEQGLSKNGLEAQEASIRKYAHDNGHEIVGIVQEIASGKLSVEDRPLLKAALADAAKVGAMLICSKVDRLARRASVVLGLMDAKVKFIISDLGETMDAFMIQIYAVFAEKEREMISKRTKDALTALKAKGVVLGNKTNLHEAQAAGGISTAAKADEFANKMKPSIKRMLDSGMTMQAIAEEFNQNGTKSSRGGQWTSRSISNIVVRWN